MKLKKANLDKRICDIECTADNTETYREFIQNSEVEFDIGPADLNTFSDIELNVYLDFIDDLWCK